MVSINIINNYYIHRRKLCSTGRTGNKTRVFFEQGELEGACAVYSLMMMLVIHQKICDEDLVTMSNKSIPAYVRQLKKQFLNCRKERGFSFMDLHKKLLKIFGSQVSVARYTMNPTKECYISEDNMYLKIKTHLDAGNPVQIGFSIPKAKSGHSVVAIGYTEYKKCLRLFCLDPSWGLDYASYWNNIIDINTDNDDVERIDYEHMSDRNIKVTGILLINEDADVINSSLPF